MGSKNQPAHGNNKKDNRRSIMIRIILPVVFFAIALLFAVPVLVAAYVASAEAQARIAEEGEL